MPTSSTTPVPEPIPEAVELLIARGIPEHVLDAEIAAFEAAYNIGLCRSPKNREALAHNLHVWAKNNKIVAAHNPGLIVRLGGAR
ncbi:hypothetical protein [Streptomyces sp. SAJ15]|uniref:hypothetical protein n=1 Tax=Streptomyces sp. SAJ15 TaxID=2011095 RepID=UPI0011861D25|nr:hypothetical protein [Streptomyces sp. SAJ15]TVL89830.1 hypothetical protein CD790_25900 [Streptomyces sp. SAJ15]